MNKIRTLLALCLTLAFMFSVVSVASAATPAQTKAMNAFDAKIAKPAQAFNAEAMKFKQANVDLQSGDLAPADFNIKVKKIAANMKAQLAAIQKAPVTTAAKTYKADTVKVLQASYDVVVTMGNAIDNNGNAKPGFSAATLQKKAQQLVALSTAYAKKYVH